MDAHTTCSQDLDITSGIGAHPGDSNSAVMRCNGNPVARTFRLALAPVAKLTVGCACRRASLAASQCRGLDPQLITWHASSRGVAIQQNTLHTILVLKTAQLLPCARVVRYAQRRCTLATARSMHTGTHAHKAQHGSTAERRNVFRAKHGKHTHPTTAHMGIHLARKPADDGTVV